MPKTRNVSRSQWETANTTSASTASRSRKEKENAREGDKENGPVGVGRSTRSQSNRTRTGILGALSPATGNAVMGKATDAPTKLRTAAKGKGKPTAAPLKRKKVPLQDITSQFLPAPEPANRGEEHQNLSEEDLALAHVEPANVIAISAPVEPTPARLPAPKFTSPLPPSSPPSPFVSSPVISSRNLTRAFIAKSGSPAHSLPQRVFDPWKEYDETHPVSHDSPAPAGSNSDPFGFVALERKLKAERDTARDAYPDRDVDADGEYDELAHVLVADTSSPRPVRRLKRALPIAADDVEDDEPDTGAGAAALAPSVLVPAPVHFATPPTPHKDKQKRRRLSHEGHCDVFSPCSSSVESSPSPTKASARKRSYSATREDPLSEFNEELEKSRDAISAQIVAIHDGPSRNLRMRSSKPAIVEDEEIHLMPKHANLAKPKKTVGKALAAATTNKADTSVEQDAEDLDLKWDRERQERVEYFRRLDDYEFEQEDVYLV
ncbi:hypothetical protein HYPSUDRAFT_196875 [Hypholoma sublateritium FD-334 SS-4]|uniref:Uncharacterized protein n=1 Tax=Hypholoma sublateritium (strain FD-334 SS-4) TaxID=945553 RepID=A0A0D2MXD2_HYPSF|nr:hypothetical protein HYPSUDRAFT_196875 [Hypholoma sublateritium FD-334 SS-4]